VSRQLDGSLTTAEHDELSTMLVKNAAARRAYVEYFQDTACLRWLCLEELSGAVEPMKSLRDNTATRAKGRRSDTYVLFGGIAAILAVATIGWLLNQWSNGPSAGERTAVAVAPPQAEKAEKKLSPAVEPAANAPQQVATITGLGSVRWADPLHRARLLSRCSVGERLQLLEGAIELTFDVGVQVTVYAPADFDITSPMSILCKQGRVTALVGDRGKGFVVQTPQAKVVDLGTQFGLSVSDNGETEVVVFQGSVDMSYAPTAAKGDAPTRRMYQGEAVLLNSVGEFQRVMSVQRNDFFTALESIRRPPPEPVIADVSDNIRTAEGVKAYQIVRGGLEEDSPAFVDRMHQWNGVDAKGLPNFLAGADYIMPFNDDKFAPGLELNVRLLRPARLYVFLDNNMEVPAWLRENFKDTGIDVGLDGAKTEWHQSHSLALGPGRSVDFPFSIWRQDVKHAGTVTLGSVNPPKLGTRSSGFNMYGIAAVATD
jgi:ferric-dicitrate binding protein FerR (iron transport regulator)